MCQNISLDCFCTSLNFVFPLLTRSHSQTVLQEGPAGLRSLPGRFRQMGKVSMVGRWRQACSGTLSYIFIFSNESRVMCQCYVLSTNKLLGHCRWLARCRPSNARIPPASRRDCSREDYCHVGTCQVRLRGEWKAERKEADDQGERVGIPGASNRYRSGVFLFMFLLQGRRDAVISFILTPHIYTGTPSFASCEN